MKSRSGDEDDDPGSNLFSSLRTLATILLAFNTADVRQISRNSCNTALNRHGYSMQPPCGAHRSPAPLLQDDQDDYLTARFRSKIVPKKDTWLLKEIALGKVEMLGKPILESYLGGGEATWLPGKRSPDLQLAFWRWIQAPSENLIPGAVVFPDLYETLFLTELVDMVDPADCGFSLRFLPSNVPGPGLQVVPAPEAFLEPEDVPPPIGGEEGVLERMAGWADRCLSPEGLKLCPYTRSSETSAAGLEAYGVQEASIYYVNSDTDTVPDLLVEFWEACNTMLERGESGCSSIIMSVPHYDSQWEEWCEIIFPLLEKSVNAADVSDELGIVCFHPDYRTPSDTWLVKNRAGHMRSVPRLRMFLDEMDPDLSAATDDDDLEWAASYHRRSPHAMINVLWVRQLSIAENVRKSDALYSRNIRKLLTAGRDRLESASAYEREE